MLVAVVVGVIVLAGVALLLSARGDTMSEELRDASDRGLPDRLLVANDIPRLRFRTALRGYRMSDVDEALERIVEAMRINENRTTATTETADRET